MRVVLCDTTVVADLLSARGRSARMRQLRGAVRAISVVTIAELRFGAIRTRWGERRRQVLEDHLRSYVVLAIDSDIAERWARLKTECEQAGHTESDNDLWIAATAARHDLPLATFDTDFVKVPGLTLVREDGTELRTPPD